MSDAHRRRSFRDEYAGKPLELPASDLPTLEEGLECQRLGVTLRQLREMTATQRKATNADVRASLRGKRQDGGFALGSIPGLDDDRARGLPDPRAQLRQPITVGDPIVATRDGDVLTLTLRTPPRTKKNSTYLGVKPSAAYTRYLLRAGELLTESMRARLGLPLPAVAFNCAARFYVDNDAADTVGLMQGLADVLEALGVVPNDRWLWTWDGTDQSVDRDRPRVELRLTPKGNR